MSTRIPTKGEMDWLRRRIDAGGTATADMHALASFAGAVEQHTGRSLYDRSAPGSRQVGSHAAVADPRVGAVFDQWRSGSLPYQQAWWAGQGGGAGQPAAGRPVNDVGLQHKKRANPLAPAFAPPPYIRRFDGWIGPDMWPDAPRAKWGKTLMHADDLGGTAGGARAPASPRRDDYDGYTSAQRAFMASRRGAVM